MTYRRYAVTIVALTVLLLLLALACLVFGSVEIPVDKIVDILSGKGSGNRAWDIIILQSRVPMIATAALAGAALSISGLLLQTTFNNPLAGPSILGVSSGAGLGVAIVILALGGSLGGMLGEGVGSHMAILVGALLGAGVVLVVLIAFSAIVRSNTMLLIIGIMVGYLASSAITLLNYMATEEGVRSYMVWGMGNFGGVTMQMMPLYAVLIGLGLMGGILLVKPLNIFMLGPEYAESLGVNTQHIRNWLLLATALLTAVTTAFCGPIAFLGLAVPHIARLIFRTDDHRRLMPATIVMGSVVALACNLICYLPESGSVIPLNAVTPLVGAPVIIYVIARQR